MVRKAGLNEAVVIQAAVELIDEEGPGALTLARLAERLGVRSPSLYKHISGLEALRQGIAIWAARELARRMSRAAIGKSGDEAVLAIAQEYRDFAKDHPGLYPLLAQAPDPADLAMEAASTEILAIIQAVLMPYGLEARESLHAIRGLRSLVHGFVSLETAGGFGMPLDIDESFLYLMERYLQGLRQSESESREGLTRRRPRRPS